MKQRHRIGLIGQSYIIVIIGVLIVGSVTYFSQKTISERRVRNYTVRFAERVCNEVTDSVKMYPTYRWLLKYWYEHADEMDVEYEAGFEKGTETQKKYESLRKRYPKLLPQYATRSQVETLPEEDQKLFAEVMYTWMLMRIDQVKRDQKPDFLFVVATDTDIGENPYGEMTYLISGANNGEKRGTELYDVYPLGTKVPSTNEENRQAMRRAVQRARKDQVTGSRTRDTTSLDKSGLYADYYNLIDIFDGYAVLVGASYDLKDIMEDVNKETVRGTLLAGAYQILLLQIILIHLFVFGIRPLKKIIKNIRRYTENKDSAEVKASLTETMSGFKAFAVRRNEIGQLAEDFTALTQEMDDYVAQIETFTAKQERIEAELNVASEIQSSMVPSTYPAFPDRTDFDLYATMDPARQVGGDFYDYFFVDEDHLALVMADVSGKSVPAALFMVISKTLIKNRAQMGESPSEILFHVNNQLCENNESGFFVTVWLAIIELSTGKGRAVNAGHEHPAICRKGGVFELDVYKHNLFIGAKPNLRFDEHEVELYPGDRLFVYTDGVPEATSDKEKLFGTDRMLESLNRNPDAPLEDLLPNLRKDISVFENGAEQFDDITMMCFWYKGKS